jgi:hypothetical protein
MPVAMRLRPGVPCVDIRGEINARQPRTLLLRCLYRVPSSFGGHYLRGKSDQSVYSRDDITLMQANDARMDTRCVHVAIIGR